LGGGNEKNHGSRLNQAKLSKIHISTNKLCVMVHAYNASYLGGGDQEDYGLRPALAKRPYLKKKKN
jgi:hypothetical protein